MRVLVFKLFAQLDIIYDPQLSTKGIATTTTTTRTTLTSLSNLGLVLWGHKLESSESII